MTKTDSKAGYILRLTLTLFLITAIVAVLLGAVNAVTEQKIADLKAEKTRAAMREVLLADEYIDGTCDTADVKAVSIAKSGGNVVGSVIEVTPSGFGGAIDMVVGVDLNGNVTGVSIISMSETSGLGDNAKKPAFREQFKGQSGTLAVSKDGGAIDALTGATITSRAVTRGVNTAIAAAATAREAK